ncbi:PREDICTED: tRNA dimethylallyltransferase, mitochondrial-like isoform X1 [Branchiostoma belcheri]|uniref:tRNA dimethylallyltransferase, mitochondrial-like isoform X1 n=1 Tax=Branchiostoma belcheri TaxID=7741 RepID=A0A6P4YEH7_BRABE|nr:PREDICTED: tRNA dimethylallyltransferase, mitochondrial-like isoform X1 [Branchiostoma belcheri]
MAASVRQVTSRLPVVVILGATGAGKSKLAIDIGTRMNGEIISADSMQVYKGLDIITNKVTEEEQRACVHHVLDVVSPLRRFTVVDFRNKALPILEDILDRQRLPIIVGGTNYYIESLLWKVLISPPEDQEETSLLFDREDAADEMMTDADLHSQLAAVDPAMAARLHPNDRRKVARSLQVFQQTGVPHSILLQEQSTQEGGGPLGGPLRYTNTCILYLSCQQQVLDERLDKRVDTMLEQGLLDELAHFHTEYNKEIVDANRQDYTRGIFQSIGFKEFHKYLLLEEERRSSDEGQRLLQEGVAALKTVTRRYARRQLKWIRNRFLKRPGGNVPQVFQVDSTNYPGRWEEDVLQPALSIVQAYVQGRDPPVPPVPYEEPRQVDRHTAYTCEVCGGRVITGQLSWEAHLASRTHQRKARKQRLREAMKQHQLEKAQQSSEASASSGEDDFAQSFSAMLEDKKD